MHVQVPPLRLYTLAGIPATPAPLTVAKVFVSIFDFIWPVTKFRVYCVECLRGTFLIFKRNRTILKVMLCRVFELVTEDKGSGVSSRGLTGPSTDGIKLSPLKVKNSNFPYLSKL